MPGEAIGFYCDEHIDRALAKSLRSHDIRVVTAVEAGAVGWSDQQHLRYAADHGLVLITRDTDFLRLNAEGYSHAGVLYAPQERRLGQLIEWALLIFATLQPEEMKNHIERVPA